nr:MAG TPA: hypothetical protein [Caudoviricetes sp.]
MLHQTRSEHTFKVGPLRIVIKYLPLYRVY